MRIIFIALLVVFYGCKSKNNVKQESNQKPSEFVPEYAPGPQALVYKTNGDYYNLVPVLLSDDKTEIVSYPHPKDLIVGADYLLPTLLDNGYLLDNRGIGKNVAFLKLTYQEYSELENPPTLPELYDYIIDKNPLTELCDCGNKTAFTDIDKQLNDLIGKKKLRTTCKTTK